MAPAPASPLILHFFHLQRKPRFFTMWKPWVRTPTPRSFLISSLLALFSLASTLSILNPSTSTFTILITYLIDANHERHLHFLLLNPIYLLSVHFHHHPLLYLLYRIHLLVFCPSLQTLVLLLTSTGQTFRSRTSGCR